MPAVAIILAISGSYTTHASEKGTNALVPGYIYPIGSCCCINITACSNVANPVLCTAIYQGITYQAFIKQSPSDTTCDIVGYKPLP